MDKAIVKQESNSIPTISTRQYSTDGFEEFSQLFEQLVNKFFTKKLGVEINYTFPRNTDSTGSTGSKK